MAWVEFVMVNGRSDEHDEPGVSREDLEYAVGLFLGQSNGVYRYLDATGATVHVLRGRVHSVRVGGT